MLLEMDSAGTRFSHQDLEQRSTVNLAGEETDFLVRSVPTSRKVPTTWSLGNTGPGSAPRIAAVTQSTYVYLIWLVSRLQLDPIGLWFVSCRRADVQHSSGRRVKLNFRFSAHCFFKLYSIFVPLLYFLSTEQQLVAVLHYFIHSYVCVKGWCGHGETVYSLQSAFAGRFLVMTSHKKQISAK